MKFEQFEPLPTRKRSPASLRDLATLFFRHKRAITMCFLAILGITFFYGIFATRMYESTLKIFVRRGRQDPAVSADPHNVATSIGSEVTEEELYSEVELFKSRDNLKQAVIETGLYRPKRYGILAQFLPAPASMPLSGNPDSDPRVVSAIKALDSALKVQPIKKTNLIQVTYESPDPALAAQVVNKLSDLYLQKHLAVHTPKGAYELFQKQSDDFRGQLDTAENDLKAFVAKTGVQNSSADSEIVMGKMAEFQSNLRQARVALEEARKRESQLTAELAHTPARYETQVKTDPTLVQQLKQSLLGLEIKQTQLETNYQPSYRPLQELQAEIAQTKKAIAEAETHPLKQETTDQEPTELWLRSELTKTRSDIAGLLARLSATSTGYQQYATQVAKLGQDGITQVDLLRRVKIAEDNYLLYSEKQEEARITEALNLQHILNVAILDPAAVPLAPVSPRWSYVLLLGFVLAGLASAGLALGLDYADPTFRTSDEVESILEVPTWAAVPNAYREA